MTSYGIEYLGAFDFFVAVFYLFVIFFGVLFYANTKKRADPTYNYFLPGLIFKIMVSIIFCILYLVKYEGGDSAAYYRSSLIIVDVLTQKGMEDFLKVWMGDYTSENYAVFDISTKWPQYWGKPREFFFSRLITPLTFLGLKRFLITTILFAAINYSGVWRLFRLFCSYFPNIRRELSWCILFLPSLTFWNSGLLKDGICFSALCWFVCSFHDFFIKRHWSFKNILFLIISIYLIASIKPYIIYALIPAALVWASHQFITSLRGIIVKILLIPIALSFIYFGSFSLINNMGDDFGVYSPDMILDKAVGNQQDLLREVEYGSNYFNLGTFDASIFSMLTKAPLAIAAGLFRPFIWEARNPMIVMAGVENLIILLLTLSVLWRLGLVNFFTKIASDPILLFSMIFVLIFSFGVAIATPNFGALVRYKIQATPFFIATLFILRNHYYSK